ncbi:MAG: M56 family metallopeptidase [Clostridiales bacterium]|nr:M56 family metallopeptidase [Clostridiales bacterium]
MSNLFIRLFNMSVTAGWLILAILLLRLFFQKAPKAIRIVLWSLAGLRLILPFSLESVLSLIPSARTVSLQPAPGLVPAVPASPALTFTTEVAARPVIDSGFPFINQAVNPALSKVQTIETGVDPVRRLLSVLTVIWLIGVAVLLVYALLAYIRLRRKVSPALKLQDNIWISDYADTPFILGLIKPRIFLPSGLAAEQLPYVVAHERAHLARKDHLWKPLGFVLLAVYWFNPLIWVAYYLFCRDIELACDERVIRSMTASDKIAYSEALLKNSVARRSIMACPLAFGAVSVKERVRSILNYKKPAFWVIVAAIAVAVVLAVCFLTDPRKERGDDPSASSPAEHEPTQLTGTGETTDLTGDDLLPELGAPALKAGEIYHSARRVYQNPLSSSYSEDSGYEYAIMEDSIVVRDKGSDIVRAVITIPDWEWQEFHYTREEWSSAEYNAAVFKEFPDTEEERDSVKYDVVVFEPFPNTKAKWGKLFLPHGLFQELELSRYRDKLYLAQDIAPNQVDYHVLSMDGELWLMSIKDIPRMGRQIWDIYALQKAGSADIRAEVPLIQVVTPAYQGKIDRKMERLIHSYITDLYQNKELGTAVDLSKYIAGESLASYLEKLISQQYQYITRIGFQRYNYLLGIEILEVEELAEDTTFVKLAVSLSYNSLGLDNYMSVGDIVNLIVSEQQGEYKVTDQYTVEGYYDTLLRGPDFNLKTEYLSHGIGSLSEQQLSAKDREVKDKIADFSQVVFPRYQSEELKDSIDEKVKETLVAFTGKLYENMKCGQTHDLSPYLEGEMLEVFLAEKIRFGQLLREMSASKRFEFSKYLSGASDQLTYEQYEIVSKLHHLEKIENDIYLAEVQVISSTQYPDSEWGGSSVQVDLLLSITSSEVKVIDCYEPNDVFDVYLRGNIALKFDYRRHRDIQHLRKIDILTKSAQLFGNYVN